MAVAAPRHLLPPIVRGLPVNDPGENVPTSLLYSSIIQAMIFGLVFTSGAGTSVFGPIYLYSSRTYPRASLSSSPSLSVFGLTMIPHFPHPIGRSTTAHLNVIHIDSALTSSRFTSWWKRIPPLKGPRASLCCDRYHSNT